MFSSVPDQWNGDIDDLAKKAEGFLRQDWRTREQGHIHPRVVRDYQRRGIISPPQRAGRRTVYSQRHVLELILSRILLADGWSLGKISESIGRMSKSDLVILIEGSAPSKMEEASSDDWHEVSDFAGQATTLISQRAALQRTRHILNITEEPPAPIARIHFQLTPWAHLAIDTDKLDWLNPRQAEELGRLVTAALITRKTKRD